MNKQQQPTEAKESSHGGGNCPKKKLSFCLSPPLFLTFVRVRVRGPVGLLDVTRSAHVVVALVYAGQSVAVSGDHAKSDNELFNRRYRDGRCWISRGGPRDIRPDPNLRAHLRLSVTRKHVALSSTNITFRRVIVYGANKKKKSKTTRWYPTVVVRPAFPIYLDEKLRVLFPRSLCRLTCRVWCDRAWLWLSLHCNPVKQEINRFYMILLLYIESI